MSAPRRSWRRWRGPRRGAARVAGVAAREFELMQRILRDGATALERADALAALERPRIPRQGRLL